MLYVERRAAIMDLLVTAGSVKVADMVERFGVDASTIRRDLKELSTENDDIEVVYGGAYIKKEAVQGLMEMSHNLKETANLKAKTIIAKKAAALVENGDTIVLNNGTTAGLVLDHLHNLEMINLITESLSIAVKAASKPFINLYLPGGKFRVPSGMFYGDLHADIIYQLSANKAFIGTMGVSIEDGLTHLVVEEATVLRAMTKISQKKYLVADSTKFGKVSLIKVGDLKEFDAFIVDDDLPDIYREFAEIHGIEII